MTDISPANEAPLVTDRRRVVVQEAEIVDAIPVRAVARRLLQVGEYYEIHGLCYVVRKITKSDVLLRRFTGTLVVHRADATPTQIKGARRA